MANVQSDENYREKHQHDLETMFREVLGNNNVYFDPPESVKLKYDCIVYERVNNSTFFANNKPYKLDTRYVVNVISRDPNTKVPDRLAEKEKCTFDRHFVVDNLHHFVFTVY
jgi:hypothetical protein